MAPKTVQLAQPNPFINEKEKTKKPLPDLACRRAPLVDSIPVLHGQSVNSLETEYEWYLAAA